MPGEKTDMVPPDHVSDELVQDLRLRFQELLEEHPDEYYESDVKRVKEDDYYCKRFLGHQKENMHYTLKMVHNALKWRKDFGIHDIREDNLPAEFFKLNALFPYNKDKEGHVVLIMRVKFHKKDNNLVLEQRKFIAYWVEKIERETKGTCGITILFDCMDAGLSNMDLDMIRFLINLFKFYYPAYLGYILVFDMPWVFNAAWKIVKTWLPNEAVQRIKFLSRPNVLQYIDKENLPISMGGTVHFSSDEPVCMIPNGIPDNQTNKSYMTLGSHTTVLSRPLQFQMPLQHQVPNSVSSATLNDTVIVGNILRICPASELVFSVPTTDTLSSAVLTLVNVCQKPVAYKVKTNNLLNYKVKPPAGGILPRDGSAEINVNVLSGHKCQPADKFLIMATEVESEDLSHEELVALWKSRHRSAICEHKLRCAEGSRASVDEVDTGNAIQQLQRFCSRLELSVNALDRKINYFGAASEAIERRQQVILYLHISLLALLAVMFLSFAFPHLMTT